MLHNFLLLSHNVEGLIGDHAVDHLIEVGRRVVISLLAVGWIGGHFRFLDLEGSRHCKLRPCGRKTINNRLYGLVIASYSTSRLV